jgi:spermidine synthase
MMWFFTFFFFSGFCSVLYELVWLRLAMAQFGVTTALTSIVLSTFMAGLGIGAWGAGAFIRRYANRPRFPVLRLYALSELLIGSSALLVPVQLQWGHRLIQNIALNVPMSSGSFYLVSGAWIAVTLVPWCACMGATIPLAMFAIRSDAGYEGGRSFSFLYVANVFGAIGGALIPLYMIEMHGFRGTLRMGAVLNAIIASSAFALSFSYPQHGRVAKPHDMSTPSGQMKQSKSVLLLLFTTGLATMGMEIVWIRLFTPFIGPVVYAFALIVSSYLLATFLGSRGYRIWSRRNALESRLAWISLSLLGLLPLVTSDLRVSLGPLSRVFLGVAPFAGVIGFLTPMLVDRWSGGDADRAGQAYAVNVAGCIVGPLLAAFILLPAFGEHVSTLLLVLPWFAMAIPWPGNGIRFSQQLAAVAIVLAAVAVSISTKGYETQFPTRKVLRDSTATVIATGEGMKKQLFTNGVSMTALAPSTKMMAHLTLASLDHPPRNVLVVCFGMGTTFRSVISWKIPGTVVELIPSVPKLFSFYHADGAQVLESSLAHVVIDDGRRYLERSPETFDAIIIDPPPPVETAGSSLLYSKEFYSLIKERLTPDGIFQQWLPFGDDTLQASVARALKESFPHVRVYHSVEHLGLHFLASMAPIPARSSAELALRMPEAAIADMMEWGPGKTPAEQFNRVLADEITLDEMVAFSPETPALQDDRPINEYYLFRSRSYRLVSLEGTLDNPPAKP